MGDSNRFLLSRHWPYRLHVLASGVSHTIARVYAERFDVTVPEWRIIAVLGGLDEGDALSGTTLSTLTAMDRVQVSRAMARMLDTGLIIRGTGREDRRTARVSLTPKGRQIYEQIVPIARAFETLLMAALAPADRTELDRIIAHLQDTAETLAALPKDELAELLEEPARG